jgi:hypothetical protein
VAPAGGNFATSCAPPTALPKANDPADEIAADISTAAIARPQRQFRAVPKLFPAVNTHAGGEVKPRSGIGTSESVGIQAVVGGKVLPSGEALQALCGTGSFNVVLDKLY